MSSSSIEWTDATWNPVTGCTKISPGCANCYIERTMPMRVAGRRFVRGRIPLEFHENRLEKPLHVKKPTRYFVNSMSDLFHDDVPEEFIDRVFSVMAMTPRHTYQVLTKRPERMFAYLTDVRADGSDTGVTGVSGAAFRVGRIVHDASNCQGCEWLPAPTWPRPNVWLGVSVENQHFADERVPLLLQTPAAVRFVSCEPLLGPVDLVDPFPTDEGKGPMGEWDYLGHPYTPVGKVYPPFGNRVCGFRVRNAYGTTERCGNFEGFPLHRGRHPFLDWVIVGGESGSGRRRFDAAWARSLRDQCRAAGTAFFMKQVGGPRPGARLEELPEDLRIREYPR